MMNEKAQPQTPVPSYPGSPPNVANPALPQSPYTPPMQPQGIPQQYTGQPHPQGQYYPQQYPAEQYPAAQPQFYPTVGGYAQGSIAPQSGSQTVPAQTIYVMGPGAQYQQQSKLHLLASPLPFPRRLITGSLFYSVCHVRERQPRCSDQVRHGGYPHRHLLLPDWPPRPLVRASQAGCCI